MIKSSYRAAIVGLGGISTVHIQSLDTLGIEISALCDNKPDRAKALGEQRKCPHYTDYETMLEKNDFDVLHICLPHYLHAPVAIAALSKGIHVICEKPMATTVQDAQNMISAADASGAKLEIIYQNRYNPGTQAIKNALDTGALGQVLEGFLQVTWNRPEEYYTQSDWRGCWGTEGGGVLINQSIHTFDLMNYFLGTPTSVNGSISNRAHPSIEVEDVADGIISYGDVNISFFVNTYHPYDAPVKLELFCENGKVALNGETATISYNDGRNITVCEDDKTTQLFGKDYWGYSHIRQIRAFYEALGGKDTCQVCSMEGLRTQRLINGIYDSAKLGKTIRIKGHGYGPENIQ